MYASMWSCPRASIATACIHELRYDDVDSTPEQLERMKALVRQRRVY